MFMNRVHEQCPKNLTRENIESKRIENGPSAPSAQPAASPRPAPDRAQAVRPARARACCRGLPRHARLSLAGTPRAPTARLPARSTPTRCCRLRPSACRPSAPAPATPAPQRLLPQRPARPAARMPCTPSTHACPAPTCAPSPAPTCVPRAPPARPAARPTPAQRLASRSMGSSPFQGLHQFFFPYYYYYYYYFSSYFQQLEKSLKLLLLLFFFIFLDTQINFKKKLFYPIFFNCTTCKILEKLFSSSFFFFISSLPCYFKKILTVKF